MGSLRRAIQRIYPPEGNTRPRNSVSMWKIRASSLVQAVANTPRIRRDCAAPCCSQRQTSCCEQTSHLSACLVVRLRDGVAPPASGGCFIPASNAVLQASVSSALLSRRQIVISSASGMNALQSRSTSGVQAMRCSCVPCEKEGARGAVAASKASDTRRCIEGVSRNRIRLFPRCMFIRGPAIFN